MEFKELMREIEITSLKIEKRISEVGGDPLTLRTDPVIVELKARLCQLHREGLIECGLCRELAGIIPVVERLYLSEEEPCCIKLLRNLGIIE